MHRCLNVPELRSRIFQYLHLGGDSDGSSDLSSLARLARTCQSFSDPALDILWRSQPGLWQLIHVLPSDLWAVTEEKVLPDDAVFFQVINFVRELRATDWERFNYYGRKIQALEDPNLDVPGAINKDTVTVHQDILVALSSYRPVLNPLPNLKKLTLNLKLAHIRKHVPFIQCFLGPSITWISIMNVPKNATFPVFSLMSRLCPNIQTIKIQPLSRTADYSPDLFQLVDNSQNLRDVQFGRWIVPTRDVVLHMGRLSSLTSWTGFSLPSDISLFTTSDGQFPNLRVFGCYFSSWTAASTVMASMKCPFESLSLRALRCKDPPSPAELISSILQNRALPLSLTHFQLFSCNCAASLPGHIMDLYQSFEPLFTLHALQSLGVYLSSHHRLDDDWLMAASRSWPLLKKLLIRGGMTTMSLDGLVPLVQGCPHLEVLALSAICHPFDLEAHPGACNKNLETICFHSSPIFHPVGVFRCLVSLFPMVKTVQHFGDSEYSQGWLELHKLLTDSLKR